MTNSFEYAAKAIEANRSGKIVHVNNAGETFFTEPKTDETRKKELVRRKRDYLLSETDKYVSVPDFPITSEKRQAYIAYRQKLRDLPTQKGFPFNIVFPEKP
ncbi:MAG: phage tail assembly chaperone [Acetobacter sp.]|nr:phage tail assembly chaperone [Acetobacter sp.]